MRESDLYPAVRNWLIAQGCTVFVEQFDADVVGVRDGKLIVVELKLCCSGDLIRQAAARATWADEVWVAIPTYDPKKKYGGFRYHGFGMLDVDVAKGKVRARFKARPQPFMWHKRRAYRLKQLGIRSQAIDTDLASLPANAARKAQRLAAVERCKKSLDGDGS